MAERVRGLVFTIEVDPRTGTAQLRNFAGETVRMTEQVKRSTVGAELAFNKLGSTLRAAIGGFGILAGIQAVRRGLHFLADSGDQARESVKRLNAIFAEASEKLIGMKDPSRLAGLYLVTLAQAVVTLAYIIEQSIVSIDKFVGRGWVMAGVAAVIGQELGLWIGSMDQIAKGADSSTVLGKMLQDLSRLRLELTSGDLPTGKGKGSAEGGGPGGTVDAVNKLKKAMSEVVDAGFAEEIDVIADATGELTDEMYEFQGPIIELTAAQLAMRDAVMQTTDALAMQVGQYIALALAGGNANLSLGKLLAAMSAQMFATSLSELAAGIAASTGAWGRALFGDPSAHFQAAAVFAAAGAALAAASRLAGGPGQTGSGARAGGGGRGGRESDSSPLPQQSGGVEQRVTVYIDGQGFIQDTDQFAQSIADSLDRVNKRRGR